MGFERADYILIGALTTAPPCLDSAHLKSRPEQPELSHEPDTSSEPGLLRAKLADAIASPCKAARCGAGCWARSTAAIRPLSSRTPTADHANNGQQFRRRR